MSLASSGSRPSKVGQRLANNGYWDGVQGRLWLTGWPGLRHAVFSTWKKSRQASRRRWHLLAQEVRQRRRERGYCLSGTGGNEREQEEGTEVSQHTGQGVLLPSWYLGMRVLTANKSTGGPVRGENAAAPIQQREEGAARALRTNVTPWATGVRTAAAAVRAGSRTAPNKSGETGGPELSLSDLLLHHPRPPTPPPPPRRRLCLDHQELGLRSPSWASGFFSFVSFYLSWQGRVHAPGGSRSEPRAVWKCWQNMPEAGPISLPCSACLPQHYCTHAFYLFNWKRLKKKKKRSRVTGLTLLLINYKKLSLNQRFLSCEMRVLNYLWGFIHIKKIKIWGTIFLLTSFVNSKGKHLARNWTKNLQKNWWGREEGRGGGR